MVDGCRLWCKHVAALGYVLMHRCETEALQLMHELGVHVLDIMNEEIEASNTGDGGGDGAGNLPGTAVNPIVL